MNKGTNPYIGYGDQELPPRAELSKEAAALLEKVEKLGKEERRVAEYFFKHISVGGLRAVLDLKRLGVQEPEEKIEKLIELGVLERGMDCYNLAKPLRDYFIKKYGVR